MSSHKKKNNKRKSHAKKTKKKRKKQKKPKKPRIQESSDDLSPFEQSSITWSESSSNDSGSYKNKKKNKKKNKNRNKNKKNKKTKTKKKKEKEKKMDQKKKQRKAKRFDTTKNKKRKRKKKEELKKESNKKRTKPREEEKKRETDNSKQKIKKLEQSTLYCKEIHKIIPRTEYKIQKLQNDIGFKINIKDEKGWSELTNEYIKVHKFQSIDEKTLKKKKSELEVTKNFHFQILILVEIGGNVEENEKLNLIIDEYQENILAQKQRKVKTEISIIGYKSEENQKGNGNKEKNLNKNENSTEDKEKETGKEKEKEKEEEKFEKISDTISLIKFTNSNLRKIFKENRHHFSSNKSYKESTNMNVMEALKIASQQNWIDYSAKAVLHFCLASNIIFEQQINDNNNKKNKEKNKEKKKETKKGKENEKEQEKDKKNENEKQKQKEKEIETKEEQKAEISKEQDQLSKIKNFFNMSNLEYFLISNEYNQKETPFLNFKKWILDQLPNAASQFFIKEYQKKTFEIVNRDIIKKFATNVSNQGFFKKGAVLKNEWDRPQEIEIKYIDFENTSFDEVINKKQMIRLKTITKTMHITKHPFSSGAQRQAYHFLDDEGNHLVLKIPNQENFQILKNDVVGKKTILDVTFEKALSELTTCYIGMFLSQEYLKKDPYKSIDVLEGFMCKVKIPSEKTLIWANAEPYLKGNFQKYTDNSLIDIHNSDIRTTFGSFIHFSSDFTDGKLIIGDLQGVEMKLTDLTISTKGSMGIGVDMGDKAFKNFFENHECSGACTKVGLPINKSFVKSKTSNEMPSILDKNTVSYHEYELICNRLFCGGNFTCKHSEYHKLNLKLCDSCKLQFSKEKNK
ncbi:eukaryotic elongation factor 2 kinase-related [Anaeramoeba flamelloides]|uniref:Eukaryotic elongation factor 2 kinase-related n=1 Tax=Anaeramoeba flamelloides TaxID=1746091 RepID=A0AAV7ZY18_9EUKA|nr:eukaryotic elongation factor 2 kinase-related [Anaeramoeba flamelloides]